MNFRPPYILSTAYFAPVQYFSRIVSSGRVVIEQFDHYSKQTYRNRCVLMGANGRLLLSIPVKKNHGRKMLTKDVRIDYDTNWQKIHQRGMMSAYRSSPFFEFYIDDFTWVFSKKINYLIDLNNRILETLIFHLKVDTSIELTDKFIDTDVPFDLRELISPKVPLSRDKNFNPVEYTQVFHEKHGFIQNLSILDLLFNAGPEATGILKKSLHRD